jgi:hypothetical protein
MVGSSLEAMRSELTAAVSGGAPGVPAATELCLACVGLFGVDGVAVSMVHEGTSRGTFGSSSETSRRLDEYQFTFGEGPCLDAVSRQQAVMAPDLDSSAERRWPAFAGAVLDEGIHAVFALPIMVTSVCIGALDLFRALPGPLDGDQLAGALMAADLASTPLLDLMASARGASDLDDDLLADGEAGWGSLAELDRIEVYQATGMVMAQLQVDATDALLRLRAHAIGTGQTASQVSWAIVERRLVLERDDDGRAGGSER